MSDLIGKRLGQYEITEAIGLGGMATVYRARQASMDRDVAIKVISNQLTDNPEFITRFEHEARLIAKLQHAHILPVYDFGREDKTIYLAMRLVDGGSLDRRLRDGALPLNVTAKLMTQIASALTYAHSEGVVHRDLKPNNILMDKSGDPYLTDFGIAKLLNSSMVLTATGAVMGTPAYMAPEQWTGQNVDARTDIYALGVMLYEMLTGTLPFTGETPFVLMHKHLDEVPPSPDKVISSLPPGVSHVINRAMAKSADERFASADQMAAAFNSAISGGATPVLNMPADEHDPTVIGLVPGAAATAKPIGTVAKEATKRALPIPLIAAVVVILIVVIGAGLFIATRRQPYSQLTTLTGHTDPVFGVAWSPDGSKIASASEDKTVRIWNAATGEDLTILRGHTDVVTSIAWSADGKKLATASEDSTIRIWNPDLGQSVAELDSPSQLSPVTVVWGPDNSTLVASYEGGAVYIWNVDTKTPKLSIANEGFSGQPVSLSPDGTKIAATMGDNSIQIVDAKTNKVLLTFAAHTDPISALTWSPDGSQLASADMGGALRTWDMRSGSAVPLLTIPAQKQGVSAVTWSPDGKSLSSSSGYINIGETDDLTANVWDSQTGKLIKTLNGFTKPVREAVWSPDGTKLATAGLDNQVVIWSTDK